MHGWGGKRKLKYGVPDDWKDPRGKTDPEGRFALRFRPPRAFQFTLDAKAAPHVEGLASLLADPEAFVRMAGQDALKKVGPAGADPAEMVRRRAEVLECRTVLRGSVGRLRLGAVCKHFVELFQHFSTILPL